MSFNIVVQVRHKYTAPAERVFDAWVTPAQASRFLFATRTGNIMQCEMDARPGGHFLVTDRRPQADGDESVFDVVHRGDYIEIDRPRKLVFDFCVPPFSEEMTRVTLEFIPLSPVSSELVLTHDMGDSEMAHANEQRTREGWAKMLAMIERELFPRRVGISL